jgi:hypothetical protein
MWMVFDDRKLTPKFRETTSFPIHKYLYSLIKWIDWQTEAVKKDMSLTFFDQSKLKIDEAGEFLNPVLCCFSNGTFIVLSPGCYGAAARQYLGPRYIQLTAWAFLPTPESDLNPGNDYKWSSFFCQTNTIIGMASFSNLIVGDFHFIWHNKLQGATKLASALAFLWKKGYDSITSLGSELQKSLSSSVMSSESLNLSSIPDIASINTSGETEQN